MKLFRFASIGCLAMAFCCYMIAASYQWTTGLLGLGLALEMFGWKLARRKSDITYSTRPKK
jgi:hypothetical protein